MADSKSAPATAGHDAAAELLKAAEWYAGGYTPGSFYKDANNDPVTLSDVLDGLRDAYLERGEALRECAAPFVFPTTASVGDKVQMVFDYEALAKEFNRRQRIAAVASGEPIASDAAHQQLAAAIRTQSDTPASK